MFNSASAAGAVAAILSHRPAQMKIAPGAQVDGGLLEVVIVRGMSLAKLLVNLPSLFMGMHGAQPSVSFYAARSMTISPGDQTRSAQVPLGLEGEAFGSEPIHVEVAPAVLEIFAPASEMSGESK